MWKGKGSCPLQHPRGGIQAQSGLSRKRFAEPLADRFERHALCTTFLNLNTIVKRHVLVFLFALLHLFEHLRFSN